MLILYCWLIVSRFHNALPHLSVALSQWKKLEEFHHVFLRMWLGVPYFAANRATLVEEHNFSLQFRRRKKSRGILQDSTRLVHLQTLLTGLWKHEARSLVVWMFSFFMRCELPPLPLLRAPHAPCAPVDIHLSISCLYKKGHMPMVAPTQVLASPSSTAYLSHLQVITVAQCIHSARHPL